jgi:hypothetical protein
MASSTVTLKVGISAAADVAVVDELVVVALDDVDDVFVGVSFPEETGFSAAQPAKINANARVLVYKIVFFTLVSSFNFYL